MEYKKRRWAYAKGVLVRRSKRVRTIEGVRSLTCMSFRNSLTLGLLDKQWDEEEMRERWDSRKTKKRRYMNEDK